MPLHIDYRPKTLDEVCGNESTIKSIKSILERENDYPHSWLFQGPSGCGKTTLARIISSELGCDINSRDFFEVNASNNRGIDTMREIVANMLYLPAESSCRIYLLDEVHATTKDAQNSLLKALEDTPNHVYFFLCTTDPEKLLPTIRNRCTTFKVEKLSTIETENLLNWVCDCEETKAIPKKVIDKISSVSEGCPRQALVLLDQIIDLEPENMIESVKKFETEEKQVIDLCRALIKNKGWKEIAKIISSLKKFAEPEKVRQAILSYMTTVAIGVGIGGEDPVAAITIIESFKDPVFYSGWAGIVLGCYDALER